MVTFLLVITAAAAAAYTDFTSRKIPNALVLVLLAAAVFLQAMHGWSSLGIALAAGVAVFLLGTLGFVLGWMGGGDVKFLAAGAVALGWPDAVMFVLYTLAAGGVLAIAGSALRGRLGLLVRNLYFMSTGVISGAGFVAPVESAGRVPYAFAILAGAVISAITSLPHFKMGISS
ncbi:MAG: prepilin peptidase [Candidatus Eremiobacteraeota bacterium]|nr:prepilin peptidase [Candidatus Eremiobacteraeota bacterium]